MDSFIRTVENVRHIVGGQKATTTTTTAATGNRVTTIVSSSAVHTLANSQSWYQYYNSTRYSITVLIYASINSSTASTKRLGYAWP